MTMEQPLALAGGRTNQVHRRGSEVWKRYDLSKVTPLFGNDPDVLIDLANQIEETILTVPGTTDVLSQ